jgi:hypothetical protein
VLRVQAELGEYAPVLQVGEAVLVHRAFPADQPVRLLLGGGQRRVPRRLRYRAPRSAVWRGDGQREVRGVSDSTRVSFSGLRT